MPRHATRQLDLSAATKTERSNKPLSEKQVREYQRALAGVQRWLAKSIRAAKTLDRYQQKAAYYERLAKKAGS